MRFTVPVLVVSALVAAGCSSQKAYQPVSPASSQGSTAAAAAKSLGTTSTSILTKAPAPKVGYEPAYVNGQTVTINAVDVPNHAPGQAQADFYEVVYPIGWQQLGLNPPQCNPCDHQGNGIDFTDFHDHILDSMPTTGGGEFSPLWHVYVIVPAYNGDPTHDAAVNTAYAAQLPTKSESAVDALLGTHLQDGSPVAVEIDTNFYFLCAIVNAHAAH
jgi:hypothetical protein